MKVIKILSITLSFVLSLTLHASAEGSAYTDIIGITHYSSGVTSQTDSIGNTHLSNGVTYYTDSIGNTHYSGGLNGISGTSYTDSIGITHFTFSDGTTITKDTDVIGNTHYTDNKGRTGTSYTDSIGNTYFSGSLFPSSCPSYQVYDNVLNKCIMKTASSGSNSNNCTQSELLSIKSKYNIETQEQQIKDLKNQITDLDTQRKLIPIKLNEEMVGRGATDSGLAPILASRLRENSNKVTALNIQLEDVYLKYTKDINLVKEECYSLGDKAYHNTLAVNTQNKTQEVVVPTVIEGGYIRWQDLYCDTGYNKDIANLKCIRDNSVAICSQNPDQNGNLSMSCRCSAGYKWAGGTKCQKYNIQTGELIEEKPVTVQTTSIVTSTTNSINQNVVKATSPVTKISDPFFTRTLKRGMSGDDVKQLQTLLQKLSYLPNTQTPSTYFGGITSSALIKFQKDNKIQPATGSFGPATQAKLLSLTK